MLVLYSRFSRFLLDGSSSFSVPEFSNNIKIAELQMSETLQNTFRNACGISLDFVRCPGVSKDKRVGFGAW